MLTLKNHTSKGVKLILVLKNVQINDFDNDFDDNPTRLFVQMRSLKRCTETFLE